MAVQAQQVAIEETLSVRAFSVITFLYSARIIIGRSRGRMRSLRSPMGRLRACETVEARDEQRADAH